MICVSDLMEPSYPTRLDDYCKYFHLSIFDVSLQCIFCSFILDTQQLADFYRKDLSLVWRNGLCFACCRQCCRLSARFEFEQYFRCSVSALMIQDVLGKPLKDIIIRCYGCMALLDLVEKYDTVCRNEQFYLVRNGWKGLCRECIPK